MLQLFLKLFLSRGPAGMLGDGGGKGNVDGALIFSTSSNCPTCSSCNLMQPVPSGGSLQAPLNNSTIPSPYHPILPLYQPMAIPPMLPKTYTTLYIYLYIYIPCLGHSTLLLLYPSQSLWVHDLTGLICLRLLL